MAGLTVKVELRGARETLAAFKRLPAVANDELRDATLALSRSLARRVSAAAASSSAQSALLAPTVRAARDRLPSIVAGGTRRVGHRRTPAYKILFGANFGAIHLRQFRPWRAGGEDDYWFFSTVEDNQAEIARQWAAMADAVAREWGSGG